MISTLVGVPAEDQEDQRRNVDGIFHIEPGVGMNNEASRNSSMAVAMYLFELMTSRRAEPQDDLMTALVNAEITEGDGTERRLTDEEVIRFGMLLYVAGTETVAKLLGNAALVLAEHPDQRAAMVASPEVIPNAVEELLRFEPPSPVTAAGPTRDVELHGTTIPAGSKVLMLTGSSGRDERVFADPDRFDVRREIAHHLTFGYGIHFCIGAALARLESRIGLEETLAPLPRVGSRPGRRHPGAHQHRAGLPRGARHPLTPDPFRGRRRRARRGRGTPASAPPPPA